MPVKKFSKILEIVCAAAIALNTVMILHNIIYENHSAAVINFFSGILLIFAYENRRNKNDK